VEDLADRWILRLLTPFRHEVLSRRRVHASEPLIDVVVDRRQQDPLANTTHPHTRPRHPKRLRQPHRLRPPVHEDLRNAGVHRTDLISWVYIKDIYHGI